MVGREAGPADLAAAVRQLAADPELRRRLREDGLDTAARYTEHAYNEAIESALRAGGSLTPPMLESSLPKILDSLGPDEVVLDIGAWGRPLTRADWVMDLMPYETRGLYGRDGPDAGALQRRHVDPSATSATASPTRSRTSRSTS